MSVIVGTFFFTVIALAAAVSFAGLWIVARKRTRNSKVGVRFVAPGKGVVRSMNAAFVATFALAVSCLFIDAGTMSTIPLALTVALFGTFFLACGQVARIATVFPHFTAGH